MPATAALVVAVASATFDARGSATSQQPSTRIEERIRALQAEADRLASASRGVLAELRGLELQRQIRTQELTRVEDELAAVTASAEAAAAELQAREAERVADTGEVADRLVTIYKRGQGGYLRLLLSTPDVRDVHRLSRGVAAVARLDAQRITRHRRLLAAQRAAAEALDGRRRETAALKEQVLEARTAADRAVATHARRLASLDEQRDQAAEYVGELQRAQSALDARLSTTGERAGPVQLPLAPFKGDLPWPSDGRVMSRFGAAGSLPGAAFTRTGIEIAAAPGSPVIAVHEGRVSYAGPFAGLGVLLVVEHEDGVHSLYGHLLRATLVEGQTVARGQALGEAGVSPAGLDTVYFELRVGNRPVDPVQWLRRSP